MTSAVRRYVRPDEKQFIFIIGTDGGFAIVETAELWEAPREGPLGVSYFCYPTVFGRELYASEEEAAVEVAARYPWAATA